ncbi:MAG TPA: nucleoside hydrolase [Pseudomonadales bacterium]|nr:nucleoside hydrolase [Pseudomonadales bacterium]
MGTALIIDTDPALDVIHEGRPRDVDDAFAIAEALGADDIDLRGVTVTFGNAPLADALRVAREVVALSGQAVPVAAGAAAAIPAAGIPPETEATHLMRRLLEAAPARIAALGPLGNLGTLLLRHPHLAERIEEVVIVAGRTQGRAFWLGEVGPVRDFNFENDVRAARVLLDSGVPVVCAGFELSSPVAMEARHLDAIAAHGSPLARRIAAGARPWLEHWTREFPADAGFHPWDSAAICWIRQPEWIRSETRRWWIRDVETGHSRGNPDGTPTRVPWLETAADPAATLRFCTGFTQDGERLFLERVVRDCR